MTTRSVAASATAASTHRGPIALTAASVALQRPPASGPFRLRSGFWAQRQAVNSSTSIPLGWQALRTHGQWDNLLRAAGRAAGAHTGRPYTDSDIYKMAEAHAWDAEHTSSPALARTRLADVADLLAAAQQPDGYINSWFQCTQTPRYSNLPMGHEMYCAGHLIQAAVAAARVLGHTRLLDAATAFADQLVRTFTDEPAVCGHPQIESALVELYRETGRAAYLELAVAMLDRRGRGLLGQGWYGPQYYQDHVPVRNASELEGHCVRALYLAAGATDVYLETGEPALLEAVVRQWEHTVATKTYLTGGVGCRRKTEAFGAPYELPPDQAFNETCAAVGNVMWSWRLLLATGEARYADHVERLLYNVIAAAVSAGGDRFAYVNTLHRRGSAMEQGDKAPFRKPWFDCACCPPNLMRTVAGLGHLIATVDTTDGAAGVALHQYAAGEVDIDLPDGGRLGLTVTTDYPWPGPVEVGIGSAPDRACGLALRIPAWCRDATVRVNDRPVEPAVPGYARLHRIWRPGDRVVLDLPATPRWTWPDRRVDAVRGCVAIEAGPVVYCFEDADTPAGTCVEDYTLDTSAPLRTVYRPDILGGTMTIECTGRRLTDPATGWPYGPEPSQPGEPGEPVTLTAIPYHRWDNRGRGRMRIWMPACAGSC
jgi:DUF1680 family protein